jgi:uncharacterized protein YdaU (DUF1376 family)
MDDREYGFFMRCLNHSWLNNGLPADVPELARVMGRSVAYVDKLWKRVGRCFVVEDGRFRNPRQEQERSRAQSTSDARASASAIRWRQQTTSKNNANAPQMETYPDSNPDPNTDTNIQSPPRVSEWPLTAIEIRRYFPACGDNQVLEIVQACLREFVSVSDGVMPQPDDEDLAEAVRISHWDGQNNPLGYRKRAAQVVRTWVERRKHREQMESRNGTRTA